MSNHPSHAAGPWIPYRDGDTVIDGEYLCFVEVPKRSHYPAHTRYMHLEYADGGFWINKGQPKGMVRWYAAVNPPLTDVAALDRVA